MVCLGVWLGIGNARAASDGAGSASDAVGTADTAATAAEAPKLTPIDGVWQNTKASFSGWNLTFHLTAVAETVLLSSLNGDYEIHTAFHNHSNWGIAGQPGIYLVYAVPLEIGGMYIAARMNHDSELLAASYAVLQAEALTLLYTTVLKLVTGRPAPNDDLVPSEASDMRALSHTFKWGFGRGGVWNGWPSGHTAVVTAAWTPLAAFYPDSLALKLTGAGLSAYMIFAATSAQSGSFHWFSDAIAGVLMAYPIGTSVGEGFRRALHGEAKEKRSAWVIVPSVGRDSTFITAARAF